MSVRKARAWATFCTGVLIVVLALIVEVLTMPKYNDYDLPDLPASEYKNAYIAVSGNTAYLYFVDKKGYIEVDPNGFGNSYTLGLTTTDPYDESKILFAEKYTATIGGDSWTAEELPDLSGVYDIPAYAQFSLPCEIGGPVWSNVTLLDQNGDVFIEGSKPIDVVASARRRYSYTLGYLMVVCAPPLKLPDKQPTAYSYNGVVLPKLPEWDKTVYPYAYLIDENINQNTYGVAFFKKAQTVLLGKLVVLPLSSLYAYKYVDDAWVDISSSYAAGISGPLIWCNADAYYSQNAENGDLVGTLYMAASEPIPVYE